MKHYQKSARMRISGGWHVAAVFLCLLLSGCSADMEEAAMVSDSDESRESTEVPVMLTFGNEWDVATDGSTRVAPPGGGGTGGDPTHTDHSISTDGKEEYQDVDMVRIITFRRKTEDGAEAPFRYDKKNDKLLPVTTDAVPGIQDEFDTPDAHKVAKGVVTKLYGYDYRIIALAYGTKTQSRFKSLSGATLFGMADNEADRFQLGPSLNENLTLEEFCAEISTTIPSDEAWKGLTNKYNAGSGDHFLTGMAIEPPQLFFGECYAEWNGEKKTVISYAETDSSGADITNLGVRGILFRGMAKVEVHVTPTPRKVMAYENEYVEWIALMADNVYTKVNLSDYDSFLHPSSPIATKGAATYTVIGCLNGILDECKAGKKQVITVYLLPCVTRLALRVKREHHLGLTDVTDTGVIVNAQIYANDQDYDTVNGTGIISPNSHDGLFYLRRNHKYVIEIKDSEAFLKKHEL